MSTDEAIAEARDMVSRHFICEPCVARGLLMAIEERDRILAHRQRLIDGQEPRCIAANRRALDERERADGLIEALEFIADHAGTEYATELGSFYFGVEACKKKARAAIATAKEGRA